MNGPNESILDKSKVTQNDCRIECVGGDEVQSLRFRVPIRVQLVVFCPDAGY